MGAICLRSFAPFDFSISAFAEFGEKTLGIFALGDVKTTDFQGRRRERSLEFAYGAISL